MISTMRPRVTFIKYPVLIISLCACFQFYKLVLQMYPSIITEQLMQDFKLTGVGLGNLAATFYYAYMVMQLFVGILLDKYSIRWLTSTAIFMCALGVFLFSQSHMLFEASLSRALMGVGVAFATVTYMKLAAVWFPPDRYAFVTGLLATAAMAGATFGEAPLSYFINDLGWRYCLSILGLAGFVIAIVFFLVVRDEPAMSQKNKISRVNFKDVLQVLKSKQNWLLTLYGGLAFSPVAIFGGLWGNPFLQQAYHLNKTQAASMVSLVFIGLGVGSPLLGLLSDHIKNRKKVMLYCTLISCIAITLIIYGQFLSTLLVAVLLFVFGFGLGAFMLVFAVGKELNNPYLTATVVAMINASDAVLDSITEPAIGKLLDITWDGWIVNNVHHFSLHSYHMALSVLPAYLILAVLAISRLELKKGLLC